MRKKLRVIHLIAILGLVLAFVAGAAAEPAVPADAGDSSSPAMVGNPAAVYCGDMGYEHAVVSDASGESGICAFPDGQVCDSWDFLKSKCGVSHSHCARLGYETVTRADGRNAFSQEYAVCMSSDGQEIGSVADLFNLGARLYGCGASPLG